MPLTHFVNAIDSRLRLGKQQSAAITSGLEEVSELDRADRARPIAFKGGSLEVRDLGMAYGELDVLKASTSR